LNFFESLYHPLYFKQFACKREFCDRSTACPYFHNEKEKAEFEMIFEQRLNMSRKIFLSSKPKGPSPTSTTQTTPTSSEKRFNAFSPSFSPV